MLTRWQRPLLACALLITPLCAEAKPDAGPSNDTALVAATVRFVESDRSTEGEPLPVGDFNIVFPFIGGALNGRPSPDRFVEPQVGTDYSFSLGLDAILDLSREAASEATIQNGGLLVEPKSTRFGRVATFAFEAMSQPTIAGTAWVDADTDEFLVLAYFDRACTVRGTLEFSGVEYRYDVAVQEPGMSWLRLREVDDQTIDVVLTPQPPRVQLQVALRDAAN